MYTPRILDFDSPSKRRKTDTGYVVVTPSPARAVELTHKPSMGKYAIVRKYAGRAWRSKYGRSLRSRARSKGSRFLKRAGRRGLSRLRGRPRTRTLMSKVGMPEGSEGCKHFPIRNDASNFMMNAYTLTSRNLTTVTKQTAALELNRRVGDQIDIKGIRFKTIYENISTLEPICVNMAIIIPKTGLDSTASIPPENFFRGDEVDRGLDIGNAMSSFVVNTRAINSDLYHILWRKRIRVCGKAGDTLLMGKHIRNFKKYIPINRQFRFDSAGNTNGLDPYIVTWYDYMQRDAAALRATPELKCMQEIYCVFKDVT